MPRSLLVILVETCCTCSGPKAAPLVKRGPLSHHANLTVTLTTRAAKDAARGTQVVAGAGEAGGPPGE